MAEGQDRYVVVQQGDSVVAYNMEIQCDTREDLEALPEDKFYPGSTCLVLEDSTVFRLGRDNIWHEL